MKPKRVLCSCISFIFLFLAAGHVPAQEHLFTVKEMKWLASHKRLRVAVGKGPFPISIWGEPHPDIKPLPQQPNGMPPMPASSSITRVEKADQHKFKGVAADYLKEISSITGISFSITHVGENNFFDLNTLLLRKKTDIVAAVRDEHPQARLLPLTEPYLRVPVVAVIPGDGFLENPAGLQGMKIAGHPDVKMALGAMGLQVDYHPRPLKEGLLGLAAGDFDAVVGGLEAICHERFVLGLTDLKVALELPPASSFSMAASVEMAECIPILNKAFRAIPEKRKEQIWNKWFDLEYGNKNRTTIWIAVLAALFCVAVLFILVGIFYYHRRISRIKSGIAALEPHLLCVHIDKNITITEVTDALCKATGFNKEDLVGKPFKVLSSPAGTVKKSLTDFLLSVSDGKPWKGEVTLVRKHDSDLWTDVVISPSQRKYDRSGYTVIFQDASKRKHFESLAVQDELTRLYNRRHFNESAPSLLNQARAQGKICAMFLLDVDNFKKFNDTYGHPAGDRVLASIGKVLKDNMQRQNDTCFRLGGEEFAVLALLSDRNEASVIANKILFSISDLDIPHQHNSPGVVTVSIGVACSCQNDEKDIHAIYSQADKNLYAAKESGKNKYILL